MTFQTFDELFRRWDHFPRREYGLLVLLSVLLWRQRLDDGFPDFRDLLWKRRRVAVALVGRYLCLELLDRLCRRTCRTHCNQFEGFDVVGDNRECRMCLESNCIVFVDQHYLPGDVCYNDEETRGASLELLESTEQQHWKLHCESEMVHRD